VKLTFFDQKRGKYLIILPSLRRNWNYLPNYLKNSLLLIEERGPRALNGPPYPKER
jgi:hypothetical protein